MAALSLLNRLTYMQALILGLVLAAFYYFLMYDSGQNQMTAIQNFKNDLAKTEAEFRRIESNYQLAKQYQVMVDQMGPSFNNLMNYLPAKMSMADLMRSISNEAKASGVSINRVGEGRSEAEKGAFYDSLKVQVDLSGTFPQLMLFLSYLTRLDQILMVDSLSLTTPSTKNIELGTSPVLQMTAQVSGFRYVPESEAPPKKAGGRK